MWNLVKDLLFPRRSLTGERGAWITEAERRQFIAHPVIEDQAVLRRRGLVALDRIVAACPYQESDLLQQAIQSFKYKRITGLVDDLSQFFIRSLPIDIRADAHATVCPVPLHWSRLFQRGFNQAALLSTSIAYGLHLPHAHLLRRRRSTGHQAWRNREDRLVALKDAFSFHGKQCPKRIILVDDLSTTGATLEECALVLKQQGAEWVEGWVIAHG